MEENKNERGPKQKMTKLEDDQNGRRPNGRRLKMKMIRMEDNQIGRQP